MTLQLDLGSLSLSDVFGLVMTTLRDFSELKESMRRMEICIVALTGLLYGATILVFVGALCYGCCLCLSAKSGRYVLSQTTSRVGICDHDAEQCLPPDNVTPAKHHHHHKQQQPEILFSPSHSSIKSMTAEQPSSLQTTLKRMCEDAV